MNHAPRTVLLVLVFLASAPVTVGLASSGEAETVYIGNGKYRATRPLWANAYAPNTPANNAGGVNDLNPGDVFSIGELSEATTVIINGFPSNVENQPNTYAHFALNEHVTFDLGAGTAIAPDAVAFDVTTNTRFVLGYRLEGSNDGNTWTKLKEHTGKKLVGSVRHSVDLAALDASTILQAKRAQSIVFPPPATSASTIRLAAIASSGLPVSYAVIEGPAKVNGNQLVLSAPGKVRLRAMQQGNQDYYSALPVERVLNLE